VIHKQRFGNQKNVVTTIPGQNRRATAPKTSRIGQAVGHGVALAICCLLSYWIITNILAAVQLMPRDHEFLGGMWAVIATILVFRFSYEESARAALSRISGTLLSFILCLLHLLILPFRPLGMAVLIGIGSVVLSLMGRSEAIITAGITTAVMMVVAGISPHARRQPILRLLDTIVGAGVGVLGTSTLWRPTSS
jgi:uncharacterized membrane protein YccC